MEKSLCKVHNYTLIWHHCDFFNIRNTVPLVLSDRLNLAIHPPQRNIHLRFMIIINKNRTVILLKI